MIRLLISLFILSACVCSCSNDADVDNSQITSGESQAVIFTGSVTRVTDNLFDSGNTISITSYSDAIAQDENIKYSWSGSAFEAVSASEAIQINESASESLSYVAVYPAQSSESFSHSIAVDQSGDGYEQSDLLVAQVAATKESTVDFVFEHQLTLLQLDIVEIDDQRSDKSEGELTAWVGSFYTVGSAVECNAAQGSYQVSNDNSLDITPKVVGDSNMAIIAPQSVEGGETLGSIKVAAGGGLIGTEYDWVLESSTEFKAGYKYLYEVSVTVKDNEVVMYVTFVEAIKSWDEVTLAGTITLSAQNAKRTLYRLDGDEDSVQIDATIEPAGASSELAWSSSNESVVTVDEMGLVTSVGNGVATVKAATSDMTAAYGQISITVETLVRTTNIAVTSQGNETIVEVGNTLQLYAAITPDDASMQDVEWSVKSGDESYVEIDSSGLVTALAKKSSGTVTLIATAMDRTGITDEFSISIADAVDAVVIDNADEIDGVAYPMNELSSGLQLSLSSGVAVKWSSSDESVATVSSSGVVTFKSLGEAVITVEGADKAGKSNSASVTMSAPAGFWRERFETNGGNTMTNYAYSTDVPAITGYQNTNSTAKNYSSSEVPQYVVDEDGNYVTVPAQRYASTYQIFYFSSVSPSDVGINSGYPYFAIHTEHHNWRSYHLTGNVVSLNQTYTVTGSSEASMSNLYKTDRSPFSATYLFTTAYDSSATIPDATSLSEYIYTTSFCHKIYHTHNIACDYILPQIPIYEARSFSSFTEYQEWAESLGGKLVSSSSVQSSKSTSTEDEIYYKQITYSDGTTEAFSSSRFKKNLTEWYEEHEDSWFDAYGFTMP